MKTNITKVLKDALVGKIIKCYEVSFDYQSILDDESHTYTQYELTDKTTPSSQLLNYKTKDAEKEILDVYCEGYSDNFGEDIEIDVIINIGEHQSFCIKIDTEFELI